MALAVIMLGIIKSIALLKPAEPATFAPRWIREYERNL
jgi:hypothetical protein